MFIPHSFLIDLIHVLPKSDQFHPTGFIHNKVVFPLYSTGIICVHQ